MLPGAFVISFLTTCVLQSTVIILRIVLICSGYADFPVVSERGGQYLYCSDVTTGTSTVINSLFVSVSNSSIATEASVALMAVDF